MLNESIFVLDIETPPPPPMNQGEPIRSPDAQILRVTSEKALHPN